MRFLIVTAIFVACAVKACGAARILGLFPAPSISHQVVYRAVMEELAKRGHELVIMTPNPVHYKDRQFENITEIDMHELSYGFWKKRVNFVDMQQKYSKPRDIIPIFKDLLLDLVDEQLGTPKMKAILRNKEEHFDLIFIESLIPLNFVAAARFNAPVIGICSLSGTISNFDAIGSPTHPVLYSDMLAHDVGELDFWKRLDRVYDSLAYRYWEWKFSEQYNKVARKHYGDNVPSIEEAEGQMSMLFLNVHPILSGIRPVTPAVVYLGGSHLKPKKTLPKDLKHFLDESTQGVIYMSLGSNVMSTDLSPQKLNTFIETFGELPYNVLWKWENDTMPGKPSNVVLSKWLPQNDLLGHKNIKAFITQGGQQSFEEAIRSNVPLIGIPFLGDQKFNVNKMVYMGIGMGLDIATLDKIALKEAVLEVAENVKYRESIARLSSVLEDRSETGLERAVWWTEYVIRHKGAHHLRAPSIPLYQYFLLDILAFVVLLLLAGVFICYRILGLLLTSFSSGDMDPFVTAIADIYSANMDQFQRQMDDLRITATIDALSLASLNKEFAAFRQRMYAMLDTIKANYIKLECRIEELEAKGRRKWLLFHGVKQEVVDNPGELVLATVNDKLGFRLTNTSIAACHRLGKAKNQQNPRPILIKFRDREDRYSI